MNPAREEILGRLRPENLQGNDSRQAVTNGEIYFPLKTSLEEEFKTNLEVLNGRVFVFSNEGKLYQALKEQILSREWKQACCLESWLQEKLRQNGISYNQCETIPEDIDAGITGCEYLVAHLGAVVVSSAQGSGRRLFACSPAHIVVAGEQQITGYLDEAYRKIMEKYGSQLPSLITTITGPSRTADIEKTLVLGAHGPKELFIYILKTNPE